MNNIISFPIENRELFSENVKKGPEHNYTGHGWEGSLYRKYKGSSTTEIAKMIRKEVRRFAKREKIKVSVRTENFTGGSEIRVEITEIRFDPFTEEWKDHLRTDRNTLPGCRHKYCPHMRWLIRKIERIVNEYNFDDSDGMIDYFSCNFYSFVTLNWELERDLEKYYEAV
jgi:hypothetical protein